MAMPNLAGSYPLDAANIKMAVAKKSPGAYALGYDGQGDGKFYVQYVGRSDDDVAGRLGSYVPSTKYKRFMYCYASSAMDAFQMECELYHGLTPPDNSIHPDRPKNANWKCPGCRNFG